MQNQEKEMGKMKRKLGINMDCMRGVVDELTVLELSHKIGFEAFTTANTDPENVAALRAKADELGMEFSFLHAPYRGINVLWEADEEAAELFAQKIRDAIDAAAAYGTASPLPEDEF